MREVDVIPHIQELCAEHSWTYYRLAKEADVPYSTINNMVNRNNIPSIPTLQRLCDAFGITLAEFFQETEKQSELDQDKAEIASMFSRMTPEQRKLFRVYAKGLLQEPVSE